MRTQQQILLKPSILESKGAATIEKALNNACPQLAIGEICKLAQKVEFIILALMKDKAPANERVFKECVLKTPTNVAIWDGLCNIHGISLSQQDLLNQDMKILTVLYHARIMLSM